MIPLVSKSFGYSSSSVPSIVCKFKPELVVAVLQKKLNLKLRSIEEPLCLILHFLRFRLLILFSSLNLRMVMIHISCSSSSPYSRLNRTSLSCFPVKQIGP